MQKIQNSVYNYYLRILLVSFVRAAIFLISILFKMLRRSHDKQNDVRTRLRILMLKRSYVPVSLLPAFGKNMVTTIVCYVKTNSFCMNITRFSIVKEWSKIFYEEIDLILRRALIVYDMPAARFKFFFSVYYQGKFLFQTFVTFKFHSILIHMVKIYIYTC